MIQTYDIQEALGIDLKDSNLPKTRAREVEAAFQELLNLDVNLIEKMTETPSNWFDVDSDDVGITVEMSDDANEVVRNGFGYFSLQETLEGYFGESSGSSNVTGLVLKRDLSIRQVIAILADSGQMKKALIIAKQMREEDDPQAPFIVAYALWKYALGWDAEKILAANEDYSKGTIAQDKGGIDGWWYKEMYQIKPGTEVTSKGRGTLMNKDIAHAGYLWNCETNELWIADMEDYNRMTGELADSLGLKAKTHLHDSERLAGDDDRLRGRPFRYVWY